VEDRLIPCLDHGYVRLVEWMGSDLSIVRSARVSYNAEWRAGEDEGKDEKLIRFLMKNRHTTPFEAVVLTFEVKAPIFVFRQWHRHRTWSYNEMSARYTELPSDFYVPAPWNIGFASKVNKQVREMRDFDDVPIDEQISIMNDIDRMKDSQKQAYELYGELMADGWPKELARAVLPVSIYSKMFATVDLHNLMHFLGLRMDKHAQWEIREYAKALFQHAVAVAPVTMKAWEDRKEGTL